MEDQRVRTVLHSKIFLAWGLTNLQTAWSSAEEV